MCGGGSPVDDFFDSITDPVKEVGGDVIKTIGNVAENIIKDPLPTIATVALTAAGVPYPVAAAAITAAQGGSVKDIAISAGTAYIGQQVGQFAGQAAGELAGETVSEATKQLITQVVTQASGPAAVVALRGGSFQDILEAGVAGGVSGAVANTLKTQFNMDPKAIDTQLLSNATNAATNAILKGKSISDAVLNAATVTALSSGIDYSVNKINENSTILKDMRSKFDSLKQSASDFFSNTLDPIQQEAQEKFEAADAARNEYMGIKAQYDEKYAEYNAAVERRDANAANAVVPEIDRLAEQLNKLAPSVDAATESFNEVFARLDPAKSTYQGFIDQLNSLSNTASQIAQEQESLASKVGEDTIKYQGAVLDERARLLEELNRQALIQTEKSLQPKLASEAETAKERIQRLFNISPEYSSLAKSAEDLISKNYAELIADRTSKLEELTDVGPPEIQAFDDGSFQAVYPDGKIKIFDDEGALFRTIEKDSPQYEDYFKGIRENTNLYKNFGTTPYEEPVVKEEVAKSGVGDAIKGLLGGLGGPGRVAQAALIGSLGAGVMKDILDEPASKIAAQGLQEGIQGLAASRQANVAPETRRAGSTFFEFVSPVQYQAATQPVAPAAPVQAAQGGLMIDSLLDPTNSVRLYAAGGGVDSGQLYRLAQASGLGTDNDTLNTLMQYIGRGMSPQDAVDLYHRRNTRSKTARTKGDMEGLMGLAKGGNLPPRYLNGSTDGMADKVPAKIGQEQPAALSHGEFVIPADVVSHLGNGNSEAGAKVLYDMMAKIRKARTGTTKQGKQINPAKFLPKG